MSEELKRCPICGAKAVLVHDGFDDYFFGYSIGCPRACINDPVHKLNEEEFKKARIVLHGFTTMEQAIEAWNRRAE